MKPYLDFAKCKWCGTRLNDVVPPEIPKDPNLIIIGEAPSRGERETKRLFSGESGELLRAIVRDKNARPIYIHSRMTWGTDKPSLEALKIERETHLLPLLAAYPGLPVVALGAYASMALLGGKQNEKKGAGEVLWLHDRPVVFTYNPAMFHFSHDERILEHIAIHIESALRPIEKPKYFLDKLTGFLKGDTPVTLDVETDDSNYPWYGSGIVVLGLFPHGGLPHVFTAKYVQKHLKEINALLEGRLVVGHNLMFDLVHSEFVGLDFSRSTFHDTFLWLKNRGIEELSLGLKFFAKRLKFPPYEGKFHAVLREMGDVRKKKNPELKAAALKMIHDMPLEDLADYNAYDLYVTEALYNTQKAESPGLFDMDMEYLRYAKAMTQNGLHVSKNKLAARARDLQHEKDKLESAVRKEHHLGVEFNFNSPPQVNSLLAQLGVKLPDTNKQTLLDHFEEHPFIEQLIAIRKVNKAIGKTKELKEYSTPEGTVHSKFSVHGTETSRMSSKEPNVENLDVAIKTVIGTRY